MKYPIGTKPKINNKVVNHANRGMSLENEINLTNEYYKKTNKAYIYKKPTPIKITKVDYKRKVISEAFFEMPSTTDYNGIYNGLYIDFEAKETKSKTSFPLKNIHKHQIKHIENVIEAKGICFLIVRFTSLNKTYLLKGTQLINFLKKETRLSIPLSYFKENGFLIKEKYEPRVDYLEFIEHMEV